MPFLYFHKRNEVVQALSWSGYWLDDEGTYFRFQGEL